MNNPFPDFVKRLPRKDYGIEGLDVHSDISESGETYFTYAEGEVVFPEHAHEAQWTVVASGADKFKKIE